MLERRRLTRKQNDFLTRKQNDFFTTHPYVFFHWFSSDLTYCTISYFFRIPCSRPINRPLRTLLLCVLFSLPSLSFPSVQCKVDYEC